MNIALFTIGSVLLIFFIYIVGDYLLEKYTWTHQSEKAYPMCYRDWQYRDANRKTTITKGVINAVL